MNTPNTNRASATSTGADVVCCEEALDGCEPIEGRFSLKARADITFITDKSNMTISKLSKLCESRNVRITSVYIGMADRNGWRANQYRVTLKFQGRQLTTDYYMGLGLDHEPTAADVLSSLCLDASAGELSFADYCSDFGANPDSREAERTHKACKAAALKVKRLLGSDFDAFASAEH